ncbi:MAG TPA: GntR family transcriptional regulator [Pyrinomonadaceae bacterium]
MLKIIQPISKKGQVVLAIRDAILSGSIQPGDQIVESKLAQQLGSGIPLVREALIELEHQGFVQKIPYKGTMVTKLGAKEIGQIFKLRIELEVLAIEWAKEQIADEDVVELRALIRKMERAAEELNLSEFYEHDLAFHRRLWAMSGNTYLVDALERVVVPLFAFFVMKTKRERDSYVESAAAHMKIVDALPEKSAKELGDLMRESLGGWKEDMLNLLFAEERQTTNGNAAEK